MFSPRLYKATGCGCVCISPGEMVRAPDSRASTGTMASPQKVDFARPPKFSSKTCDHMTPGLLAKKKMVHADTRCSSKKHKKGSENDMPLAGMKESYISDCNLSYAIIYHNFIAGNMRCISVLPMVTHHDTLFSMVCPCCPTPTALSPLTQSPET